MTTKYIAHGTGNEESNGEDQNNDGDDNVVNLWFSIRDGTR